jgi:hypothetical protein
MDSFVDYYEVLGVDAKASASTIKGAFKKLALKYHPDVYKGEDAQERMRLLLSAYQTLSDPEARRNYDAIRAERIMGGTARTYHPTSNTSVSRPINKVGGRFAFPNLDGALSAPIIVEVNGFSYELWPDDALLLREKGMLRGNAPSPVRSAEYYCHRCHNRWRAAGDMPELCPKCKARDWAEYLLMRCTHCEAVFESEEVRDHVLGDGRLYYPYELFPLCPNCRRSSWCPAENTRLDAVRAGILRRNAMLWIGAALMALVVLGVLLMTVWRV